MTVNKISGTTEAGVRFYVTESGMNFSTQGMYIGWDLKNIKIGKLSDGNKKPFWYISCDELQHSFTVYLAESEALLIADALGCKIEIITSENDTKYKNLLKVEPVYSTHCMRCDNGKNYQIDDNIPESCPVCGEHKEYSIVNMNSLSGNYD